MIYSDTPSFAKKWVKLFHDGVEDLSQNTFFYMLVLFVLGIQFFIDHLAFFVSQYRKCPPSSFEPCPFCPDLFFDLIIRACCFFLVSCVFSMVDLTEDGLERVQLKVLVLVWLTCAI